MMKGWEDYVAEKVHYFYHEAGINCAVGTLILLSDLFGVELQEQVYDSAIAMHGAGKYGAQCGILEGGIMFASIYAKQNGLEKKEIVPIIYKWSSLFEKEMGSLVCRELRPYPFTPEDAPKHLCEPITVKGVKLAVKFIQEELEPSFANCRRNGDEV
jgi:hypothetical protein